VVEFKFIVLFSFSVLVIIKKTLIIPKRNIR